MPFILIGCAENAEACSVPSFLEVGSSYKMGISGGRPNEAKIIEIDNKSCWAKIDSGKQGVFWINLNQITVVIPEEK